MRAPVRLLIPLAATAVLAACATTTSGTGARAPGPTGSTSSTKSSTKSTAVPQPTPVVWSKKVAGEHYLEYTATFNAHVKVLNGLYDNNVKSVSTWNATCQVMANDQRLFRTNLQNALSAGHWPTTARGPISGFIASIPDDIRIFTACSKATSVAQAQKVLKEPTNSGTYSKKVRSALGLPPPPK